MRELVIAWVVVGAELAHAEESIRASSLLREQDGPWLHLDDGLLAPGLEAFDADREARTTSLQLGPNTQLAVSGSWWSAQQDMRLDGGPGASDIPGRGYKAGVRLSHDFGIFRVTAHGSVNHVDTPYGSGAYTDVGLSISRTHRFSRWMTGWISLDIGRRQWRDVPPDGEADATQVMLTIGTTFR